MRSSRGLMVLALVTSSAVAFAVTPREGTTEQAATLLQCPAVLEVRVTAKRYPGWFVYTNDPLRLTGADVAYLWHGEDATLDPDDSTALGDTGPSVIYVFRLSRHPEAKAPELVCHYGEHAQLSRRIPHGATQCSITWHRWLGEPDEPEYLASCR